MLWMIMAVLSAVFAGMTTILAKCGIKNTDSDVATAIRTVIVLIFSWVMVFLVQSADTIYQIEMKSFVFLFLSGLATGLSWICYFKALSRADVNKVVPIDKSSTVLTVLLAILLFHETHNLPVKLAGTVAIGIGALLMIERKDVVPKKSEKGWFLYAVLSAVFAALTSILAKVGISGVESNLGTALRTCVVLVLAWGIVFGKGKQHLVREINRREMIFICLSGLATGASWLCYYYAIQTGVVSVVVPIDKMSILITITFSYIFLKEKLTKKSFAGLMLMAAGTLAMAIFA
jgi:transporter family protein